MFATIRELVRRQHTRPIRCPRAAFRPRLEALEDRIALNTTDLSITMAVLPNPAVVNQPVTYALTVVNNGPMNSFGSPAIIDTLPANLGVVSVTTSQGIVVLNSGGQVGVTLGVMNVGTAVVVTIQGTPTVTGTLANSAVVNAGGTDVDPNLSNNSAALATAVVPTPPALTSAQIPSFVNQVYLHLLNRPPDAPGAATFTGFLANGGLSPNQVVQVIQASSEYRALKIEQLYNQLLKRPADSVGLTSWLNFLAQGGSIAQVEAAILGSDEYFQSRGAGTNAGFVQAVAQDVLARSLEASGAQFFGQALTTGTPRLQIAEQLLASTEAALDQVEALYPQLLGRPVDASGLATFSQALASNAAGNFSFASIGPGGLSSDQVIATLLSSAEFIGRLP